MNLAPVQSPKTTPESAATQAIKSTLPEEHTFLQEADAMETRLAAGNPLGGAIPPSSFRSSAGMIQCKLEITAADDAFEQEADAVADQVLKNGLNLSEEKKNAHSQSPLTGTSFQGVSVQRKCDACKEEDEEKGKIQRKSTSNEGKSEATPTLSTQIQSTRGGGTTLDGATRSFMESGFGHDFSQVKIHTGAQAAQMSRDLSAKAFTIGNDIYFNSGQYQPDSESGKRLLAHELTHTIQQSQDLRLKSTIQRACDTVAYDAKIAEVKALPLFSNIPAHPKSMTPAEAKAMAETIMTEAKARDNCMFYAEAMHKLFSTDEAAPSTIKAAFGPEMAQAKADEEKRLLTTEGKRDKDVEETMRKRATNLKPQIGEDGKTYMIDQTDPANVIVYAKVWPKGEITAVSQLIAIEDAVEKKSSVLGYTVDLEFVNAPGKDVFEVGVDPGAWPTSGNWVKGPDAIAHELHHLLGLDDRYNYIERHPGNEKMFISDRIHWFNKEFRRNPDKLKLVSFMGKGRLVTDQDICEVMKAPDMPACLATRKQLRQPTIDFIAKVAAKCARMIEITNNVNTNDQERNNLETIGKSALANYNAADVVAHLTAIATNLKAAEVQMENASGTECATSPVSYINKPNAFIVCPAFTKLSDDNKANHLTKNAFLVDPPKGAAGGMAEAYGLFMESVFTTI